MSEESCTFSPLFTAVCFVKPSVFLEGGEDREGVEVSAPLVTSQGADLIVP